MPTVAQLHHDADLMLYEVGIEFNERPDGFFEHDRGFNQRPHVFFERPDDSLEYGNVFK